MMPVPAPSGTGIASGGTMKGAAKVIMGAAAGALLVSSAGADQPRRLTAQYHYDRAITAEMVLLDAIQNNKPRRLLTLHNALLDEFDVLRGKAVVDEGGIFCGGLIVSLAVVALAAHEHVDNRTSPTSMANSAWINYRQQMARCEQRPDVVVVERKLPDKLSEVF